MIQSNIDFSSIPSTSETIDYIINLISQIEPLAKMGNSLKKPLTEAAVDGGGVLPTSLYPPIKQDYEQRLMKKLIMDRRLQPIYNGVGDLEGEEFVFCCDDSKECHQIDLKTAKKLEPLELSSFISTNLAECPICFLV